MRNQKHIISYSQAFSISENYKKQLKGNRRVKFFEFMESNHELFNHYDFEYYAAEIGLKFETIIELSLYSQFLQVEANKALTNDLVKKQFCTPYLKFNPFKKRYFYFHEHLEKWIPAQEYHIKKELKAIEN